MGFRKQKKVVRDMMYFYSSAYHDLISKFNMDWLDYSRHFFESTWFPTAQMWCSAIFWKEFFQKSAWLL